MDAEDFQKRMSRWNIMKNDYEWHPSRRLLGKKSDRSFSRPKLSNSCTGLTAADWCRFTSCVPPAALLGFTPETYASWGTVARSMQIYVVFHFQVIFGGLEFKSSWTSDSDSAFTGILQEFVMFGFLTWNGSGFWFLSLPLILGLHISHTSLKCFASYHTFLVNKLSFIHSFCDLGAWLNSSRNLRSTSLQ